MRGGLDKKLGQSMAHREKIVMIMGGSEQGAAADSWIKGP